MEHYVGDLLLREQGDDERYEAGVLLKVVLGRWTMHNDSFLVVFPGASGFGGTPFWTTHYWVDKWKENAKKFL